MGSPQLRLTVQTLKVLGALMASLDTDISGADIARSTKLASGTLYPILIRLEDVEWVGSHWESETPHHLGRPRRRLYRLTGVGAKKARSAFRELVVPLEEFAWR